MPDHKNNSRLPSALSHAVLLLSLCSAVLLRPAYGGEQQYEPMTHTVRAALHSAVSDLPPSDFTLHKSKDGRRWLAEMSTRLEKRIPDKAYREELLTSIYYEAGRAGLNPQMVLALIQVESAFRKYAVSSAGARGYMQVMPFWTELIGTPEDNLFHLRKNLRYGCTILRHYIDIEKGDLFRALGRYNGSLGKAKYPNLIKKAWDNNWQYEQSKLPIFSKLLQRTSTKK